MEGNRARTLASLVIGVGLIGAGVLFLLGAVLKFNIWSVLWPFFIIVPGLLFFVGMVASGKSGAPLAVPGSIITMVGLLLLFQSITGLWASWAYAWALIFPTGVGLGIAIAGVWGGNAQATRTGSVMAGIGFGIFVFFALVFELIFNISGFRIGTAGRIVLPAMVIGAGVLVLLLAFLPRKRGSA